MRPCLKGVEVESVEIVMDGLESCVAKKCVRWERIVKLC